MSESTEASASKGRIGTEAVPAPEGENSGGKFWQSVVGTAKRLYEKFFLKPESSHYTTQAANVIEAERLWLQSNVVHGADGQPIKDRKVYGLAFSGGGIRSASFNCGVMEALANQGTATGYLTSFDYLSTVSGGGYAGTALTWAVHNRRKRKTETGSAAPEPTANDFPFVVKSGKATAASLISQIRSKANYLLPSRKIDIFAAVLNAVKTALISFAIYFGLMIGIALPVITGMNDLATLKADAAAQWLRAAFSWLRSVADTPFVQGIQAEHISSSYGEKVLRNIKDAYQAIQNSPAALPASGIDAVYTNVETVALKLLIVWVVAGTIYLIFRVLAKLLGFVALPIYKILTAIFGFSKGLKTWLVKQERKLYDYQQRRKSVEDFGIAVKSYIVIGCLLGLPFLQPLFAYLWSLFSPASIADQPLQNMDWITAKALVAISAGSALFGLLSQIRAFSLRMQRLLMLLALFGCVIVVLFTTYAVACWLIASSGLAYGVDAWWKWLLYAVFWMVLTGAAQNINIFTPHFYYRDRLMEAFMPPHSIEGRANDDPDATPLYKMCRCDPEEDVEGVRMRAAPYHLINTNVILVNSGRGKFYQRGGDSFILSPLFCGSDATGWIKTDHYGRNPREDTLTLATAMAISGAATNPGTSSTGKAPRQEFSMNFLARLLNLRLGYWRANPRQLEGNPKVKPKPKDDNNRGIAEPSFIWPGLSSLFTSMADEMGDYIELTDGGHFDNTGLYELFRRKAKVVVMSDASCDPKWDFSDLGRALALAQSDFGVTVDFIDLPQGNRLEAMQAMLRARGFVKGKIYYPGDQKPSGDLYYIKATLLDDAPSRAFTYAAGNAEFPHESTLNQFYSEVQFEAYRSLGNMAAQHVLDDMKSAGHLPRV